MPIIAIYAIVAAVIFFAGTGTGWLVKDWKDGSKIAKLESRDAVAIQANVQCKNDVDAVRQGVESIKEAAVERTKAAESEMIQIQPKAATHTQRAITIIAAPIHKDETLCQAVEREQIEYVQKRHTDS